MLQITKKKINMSKELLSKIEWACCTNDNLIKEYKIKRDECTTILNKHRKNLKTANYILEDTPKVKAVVEIEKQMKREQEDVTKTKNKDRYVRW